GEPEAGCDRRDVDVELVTAFPEPEPQFPPSDSRGYRWHHVTSLLRELMNDQYATWFVPTMHVVSVWQVTVTRGCCFFSGVNRLVDGVGVNAAGCQSPSKRHG